MTAALTGPWRAHRSDGDLARAFAEPGFDDSGWVSIDVPSHWRSSPAFATDDGPLLYRRRFHADRPGAGGRAFLTFDGLFYFGDAWLDGDYLGATEGYFSPQTFEVTEHLGRDADEHVVAVEVACPPQADRRRKRLLTGVFSHWDAIDPAWNPGGIWRPVGLTETGPVRIARVRVLCAEASESRGRLQLDVTLDAGEGPSPAGPTAAARLVARVTGPTGSVLVDAVRPVDLAAGDNQLRWTLTVDDPPRWWPWRLGDERNLCDVELTIELDGVPSHTVRRRTAFREVRLDRWRWSVNGEPLYVMGSNQGPNRIALAAATREELRHDVGLAVRANLDLLRIHAHVSRPELYEAADEAGLLLWQDFPLQWGYARGLRRQASRQAREMTDLLGHHPSIVLWCAHNEPVRTAGGVHPGRTTIRRAAAFASHLLPNENKLILDRSVSRALRRADGTRPVDPHSGVLPGVGSAGTDSHLYFGWYHGSLDGLAPALRIVPRLARFVSEFGAQAVPGQAAFARPERWPDLDWEALAEHHCLQRSVFDRHVPPAHYDTFDAWRDATQEYQAALIQMQVEDLRRIAGRPGGGFCHFSFADAQPAITWSVLDHLRTPKTGFAALRDACRTVLPMLDPRTGALHVANAGRHDLTGAVLHVDDGRGRVRRFTGDAPASCVVYVGRIDAPAANGHRPTGVDLTLDHPDTGPVVNRYDRVLAWMPALSKSDPNGPAR